MEILLSGLKKHYTFLTFCSPLDHCTTQYFVLKKTEQLFKQGQKVVHKISTQYYHFLQIFHKIIIAATSHDVPFVTYKNLY